MDQRQQHRSDLPSERHPVSRPQMFMHLEFGLSWSQRHTPQKHSITYTSRSLRDSRARNSFPRQLPPPNANFLGHDPSYQPRARRSPDHQGRQYHAHIQQQQQQQYYHEQHPLNHRRQSRGHDRPAHAHLPREINARERGQGQGHAREQEPEQRRSRSESRGLSHDRGRSAPPPFHDSPWDTAPGPSASLFPPARPEAAEAAPRGGPAPGTSTKPLPATPSHFRLGEDALPWSAWAWPADAEHHGSAAEAPYTSQPTTVPISPGLRSGDDPQRVRELESLSAAMVTVDNGFENQWWYQGPRETTAWWPRDQEEPSRLSLADDLLFSCSSSAMEPADCAAVDDWHGPPYSDESPLFDGIVSPVSTASPARPLQRSMTTRSEELFIMSDGR